MLGRRTTWRLLAAGFAIAACGCGGLFLYGVWLYVADVPIFGVPAIPLPPRGLPQMVGGVAGAVVCLMLTFASLRRVVGAA